MYRTIALILTIICMVGLCLIGYAWGQNIPFSTQWPLYEALRNTASIIFAVVGAWLAIVYPERFKLSLGRTDDASPSKASRSMGMLLLPAVHSTILLVILLLIGVIAPLIKEMNFIQQYTSEARGVSYSFLVALTCWQIIIVVMTLFPAEAIQTQATKEQAMEELDAQHTKLRQNK